MIYRKIESSEAKEFANLSATAFHGNAEEAYKEIEKGTFALDTIRVLEDDNNKIIAGLRLWDMDMYLDTKCVRTGGIGDVSSYPEYRRGGNVSKIFDEVLKEMYENDYVLSYLYPFSHPFYRKYGYELCRKKEIVSFETSSIEYKKDDCYAKQHVYKGDNDLSDDIKKIYNKYADKMNFMVDRKGWFWERQLKDDAYTSKCKTYVCYSADNEPIAYFKYEYERINVAFLKAKIFDMAFVNREAFDIMLKFIYRLAPSIKEVTFACPAVINSFEILDKAWAITSKCEPGGMMRIVNVQKALSAIKVPKSNMTVSIKVTDTAILQNDEVFTMDISDGNAVVKKDNNANADMECSIHALAQLVSGFRCLDEIISRDDIKVNSKMDELSMLFVKKLIHTQDFF